MFMQFIIDFFKNFGKNAAISKFLKQFSDRQLAILHVALLHLEANDATNFRFNPTDSDIMKLVEMGMLIRQGNTLIIKEFAIEAAKLEQELLSKAIEKRIAHNKAALVSLWEDMKKAGTRFLKDLSF